MFDARRERELAKERGYDLIRPIDEAYACGEITQFEWHRRVQAVIEPAYLSATTEQQGSGHSGTEQEWHASRSLIMHAVDRPGTFLDVGCANGLLMASVERWSRHRSLAVEPYGVEISPALADRARARYPQWHDRIWTANADGWYPPMRFDFVRTGLEYVPRQRREGFVRHLFDHVVAPDGRLIIGKTNENRGESEVADGLRSWGWTEMREVRRAQAHPDVEMSVVWVSQSRQPPPPACDAAD
ncbi:class I SAM-dependent methyltransferase [Actinoplanes sp. TRM 88003]|uniref:Class I SAM-dependent methyltransferase n=1 Tax=Paractinoplanes aksuensis TaxID=2939490 RepID=A0ABT1E4M1_9ACTN|nr:class I SAM-dependent methyltransferase [Actinoplanes aksuensis]MCO8277972.1 class I SAM-dependent methyltransferase [Actinoplanes aksuensis]